MCIGSMWEHYVDVFLRWERDAGCYACSKKFYAIGI